MKTTPIEEDESTGEINESVEIVQLSESQRKILKTTWMTLSLEFGQGFSYLKNDSEDNPVTEPFLRYIWAKSKMDQNCKTCLKTTSENKDHWQKRPQRGEGTVHEYGVNMIILDDFS